jgi:hypothetical protein
VPCVHESDKNWIHSYVRTFSTVGGGPTFGAHAAYEISWEGRASPSPMCHSSIRATVVRHVADVQMIVRRRALRAVPMSRLRADVACPTIHPEADPPKTEAEDCSSASDTSS